MRSAARSTPGATARAHASAGALRQRRAALCSCGCTSGALFDKSMRGAHAARGLHVVAPSGPKRARASSTGALQAMQGRTAHAPGAHHLASPHCHALQCGMR